MYEVRMKNGTVVHSAAPNYEKLIHNLVGMGIKPKAINKIWTIVPLDMVHYNKVKKGALSEER